MTREQARQICVDGLGRAVGSWVLWARLSGDQRRVMKAAQQVCGADEPVADAWLDAVASRADQIPYGAVEPRAGDVQGELEALAARAGVSPAQAAAVLDALFAAPVRRPPA